MKHNDIEELTMTQVSEFDPISKWIRDSWNKIDSTFLDGNESEPFFGYLISLTSINQVEVFDSMPSSDSLHYFSNGKSDNGKTKEFIDNFDNFKLVLESAIKLYEMHKLTPGELETFLFDGVSGNLNTFDISK